MKVKNYIPNLFTLGNLLCGTLAAIFAVKGDFTSTALLVALGVGFDFIDGFAARLLNVQGELGKQLDSLADMVTSGVAPGIVMMQLIINAIDTDAIGYFGMDKEGITGSFIPYIGLLLTLFAGYRLAKFNIDERQSDSFIGLPTPAMSLFVVSLPLIANYDTQSFFVELILNRFFLITTTLFLGILMISELPLFSLKFKSYALKDNAVTYLFLMMSLILILVIKFAAIPLIILFYIFLSIVLNLINKKYTTKITSTD